MVQSYEHAECHEDRRTIGAYNLQHMMIMVDFTHAVHEDMSRHKGGMISFGT